MRCVCGFGACVCVCGAKHSPLMKILGWPKAAFQGGCRANLFFCTSIENFEYQLTILSDGAGCPDAGVLELHFGQGNS